MDAKRQFDVRQAAQIRADVYNEKRRQYRESERMRKGFEDLFRGKSRGKSSGGGLSFFGVLFIGVLIGAGILGGGAKKPATAPVSSAQVPAPDVQPTIQPVPYVAPAPPAYQPQPYAQPTPTVATRLGVVYSDRPPVLAASPSSPDNLAVPAAMPQPQAAIDTGAEVVAMSNPRYPAQAIRQRHEGTVQVLVSVGPDGAVQSAAIQSSSGFPELDQSAVESVYRWHFRPASSHGQAMASQVSVPIHFNLNQL